MFLNRSILQSEMKSSPLGGQSVLGPKTGKRVRPMMFTLALTSLIDAFSILVIFLLIQGPSGQKELPVGKDVQLPSVQTFVPMDEGVAVRIENGHYFVDEKEVTTNDLVKKLYEIRQQLIESKAKNDKSLIVQADKRSDFQSINPIIQAGAQTGFEQIKFAVLPRKGS
jgi:biopolymer transport protein ExbD